MCEVKTSWPIRFGLRGRMRRRAKPGGEVAGGDGKADCKGPRGAKGACTGELKEGTLPKATRRARKRVRVLRKSCKGTWENCQ